MVYCVTKAYLALTGASDVPRGFADEPRTLIGDFTPEEKLPNRYPESFAL